MMLTFRIRRLFLLGLASAALSLAGCAAATGPAFQRAADVAPDKALIYIYRDQAMHGAAFTPTVTVNETTRFALERGGYYPYVATPGKVTIKVTNVGSMTKVIDAVAGETYYVKAGTVVMGLGIPFVQAAKTEIAVKELQECKLLLASTSDATPASK